MNRKEILYFVDEETLGSLDNKWEKLRATDKSNSAL